MVGPRRKISKLHWLNTLKQSPKNWNLDQKINFLKPHIWSLPFHFRFSSRMSQSQQKLAKNITHPTIPFCSKNLTYFTNLNCFNIVKNIFPQHSKKPAHFTNFPANIFQQHVSGCCQKKTCTAPFLEAKELHSRTTGKAFLYMSVRSFYLVVGRITSLRRIGVCAL